MNEHLKKTFIKEIDKAQEKIKSLIQDRKSNVGGKHIEKTYELQVILNDLHKMKSQVITDTVPLKENRFVQYEVFITERWGLRHELGKELLNISTIYTSSF